jgi:DNA-binding beta-propeller fold protein YncE
MLTLLALLAGAAPGPRVTISAPPRPLVVGKPWNATLVVKPPPRSTPRVVARPPSGRTLVVRSRRVGRGKYKVRLVLKRAGRWTVSARIGTRTRKLRSVTVSPLPPPTSPLPGGTAYRVCGGAREPFLQYGLAIGYGSAWVACHEQRAVQRVDLATGRVFPLIYVTEPVWAVTAGEGGVWAIALRGSAVHRIDPVSSRVTATISLSGSVPYAWAGGGALWAADDEGQVLIRIDPATNAEVARLAVGNGPAGFAFDGSFAWVLNHRENTLDRINPVTNGVTRMATIPGGEQVAAERIAVFGGDLWITGRGLDLLRVSRSNGAVLGQTEIGAGGIDVVTDATNLWTVPYQAAADQRGEPVPDAVLRVDASGAVARRITPTRQFHADGVAAANGELWLFDAVAGLLVRLPA